MAIIELKNIYKTFYYRNSSLFNFFKPRSFTEKQAVVDLTFIINPGEIVGYIGLNGSGKSTTIKMLTGILKPTAGSITVANYDPFVNRKQNARNIGVLFGQRTQLWWDLPLLDTLKLHKHLYNLSNTSFCAQLEWILEVLELNEIYKVPIRKLSFGQRMRCELALTLLHKPTILYLDEPTIGMDMMVKKKIRNYLLKINQQEKVTIFFTSHDLNEITHICNRIIIIHKGRLLFDGTIAALTKEYMPQSIVQLKCADGLPSELASRLPNFTELEDRYICFTMDKKKEEFDIVSALYRSYKVTDLKIREYLTYHLFHYSHGFRHSHCYYF